MLENDTDYTDIEAHPLVGSWIGDNARIVGDDYGQDFNTIDEKYADIGQSTIEMLVEVNPYDLLEYGGVEWLERLVEDNGKPISISNEMRKRLSHVFRHENYHYPTDDLARAIQALKKLGQPEGD